MANWDNGDRVYVITAPSLGYGTVKEVRNTNSIKVKFDRGLTDWFDAKELARVPKGKENK